MKRVLFALIPLIISTVATAQANKYKVSVIGFYNLENYYDTIDNPIVNDEEFLPSSDRRYNTHIYYDKIDRLSTVLSQMGTEISPDGLSIIGVAEIENDTVLTDLVNAPKLKDRKWKFVHYDSPDLRGVDVALLYNPKYFKPVFSAPLFVQLPGGSKEAYFTRDVLYVKGVLDGDTIHVFVNHWPSRSGGEERSIPARAAAAGVAKKRIDSLMAINPNTKVVLMGDLNDDPVSPSLTKVIGSKGKMADVANKDMFNPWVDFYKKGLGTTPYQDAWSLFDQVLVSGAWLPKEQSGYHYYKPVIFNKEFMVQKTGKFRGYSKRTWDGITYNYGYSDHFPVYIVMLKPVP
ncbi:MAG TPA: endonuclease/exonuclease/phosphatase [Ferruginibacter sp.]|nr:endonuclease/exonuclease/phosphatase [Ferruginibacter sp.]